jgi:hypothetical protein
LPAASTVTLPAAHARWKWPAAEKKLRHPQLIWSPC